MAPETSDVVWQVMDEGALSRPMSTGQIMYLYSTGKLAASTRVWSAGTGWTTASRAFGALDPATVGPMAPPPDVTPLPVTGITLGIIASLIGVVGGALNWASVLGGRMSSDAEYIATNFPLVAMVRTVRPPVDIALGLALFAGVVMTMRRSAAGFHVVRWASAGAILMVAMGALGSLGGFISGPKWSSLPGVMQNWILLGTLGGAIVAIVFNALIWALLAPAAVPEKTTGEA